jgi:hypothetical protein
MHRVGISVIALGSMVPSEVFRVGIQNGCLPPLFETFPPGLDAGAGNDRTRTSLFPESFDPYASQRPSPHRLNPVDFTPAASPSRTF